MFYIIFSTLLYIKNYFKIKKIKKNKSQVQRSEEIVTDLLPALTDLPPVPT